MQDGGRSFPLFITDIGKNSKGRFNLYAKRKATSVSKYIHVRVIKTIASLKIKNKTYKISQAAQAIMSLFYVS